MELDAQQVAKIDPLLQEALSQAQGDEEIRAIVVLDAPITLVGKVLSPADFPSRQAYREALVAQRKDQMGTALEESLHQLRRLDLKPVGDSVSPVVMVEGAAKQLLHALNLSGVRHANLDQFIGLPQIAPAEQVDHLANLYMKVLDQPLDTKTQNLITLACEQYLLNYYKNYGKVQVLGMPKPVDLDSIYTAVKCLDKLSIWQINSEEELHQALRTSMRRSLRVKTDESLDGLSIAKQTQYLMVVGAPGAGKSTFLRKLGLEVFKGQKGIFDRDYFPIMLELKRFKEPSLDLKQRLSYELQELQLPNPSQFLEKALEAGKLLILLDGLDEVPTENVYQVISQIGSLVQSFPDTWIITSCRLAAYSTHLSFHREILEKFKCIEISDFDDVQIHQFIQSWFSLNVDQQENTAESCWQLLNEPDHASTKELARTPLLLTFLCLVYDQSQTFPKNRSTLYGEALDILLKKWWSQRRVSIRPIYNQIGIELEKNMLTDIAYKSFVEDQLFFSKKDLTLEIKKFLIRHTYSPQTLDPEFVLDSIAIQQGIWVERSRDIFSFSHLTLHEYLTAHYIYDHDLIDELVKHYILDRRWKEVFILLSGLMRPGADKLVLKIESAANDFLKIANIPRLLSWVNKATKSSTASTASDRFIAFIVALVIADLNVYNYPDSMFNKRRNREKTASGLLYRLRSLIAGTSLVFGSSLLSRFQSLTRHVHFLAMFNISRSIISYLGKRNIFHDVDFVRFRSNLEQLDANSREARTKDIQGLIESFAMIWRETFYLDKDLANLSVNEIESLENYFSAIQLMYACRKSAVTVSKDTWSAIEGRILKVD